MSPSISLAEKYNDNIFSQRSDKKSDFISVLNAAMAVKATNTPHTLALNAGLTRNQYANYWQDSFTDYNAGLNGRHVFDRDAYLGASGGYRYLHSQRGNSQSDPDSNAASALPYHDYRAGTDFYKRFGGFTILPRVNITKYQYENMRRLNGLVLDQEGRSRNEYRYGGELGYDILSALKVFGDLGFTKYDYKRKDSVNRDSRGNKYLVGLQYRPNSDILAKFGGGYMRRTWKLNNTYRNVGAWNALARLDWQFNKAGKINYTLGRSIDEVTNRNTSASVCTNMKVSVSYLLPADILGTLGYRYAMYNYQGGLGASGGARDKRDNLREGTFDLAYKCHECVTLNANYTYTDYKSNYINSNYKRNVVMIGAKFGI